MLITDEAILAGTEQVIQRCLGLTAGQELLIFVDETTIEVGQVLAETAHRLDVPQTTIFVPVSVQYSIPEASDFSLLTRGAAKDARAILTCVNALPDCLAFREYVLETHWSARTRIGHMPGANLEMLKLANVDLHQLVEDCRLIEVAMARGHTLELISYASDGTPSRLAVDIGGWDRLPVASDSVIGDGMWGNIPSGETYIAPIRDTGEGSILINGSIPGLVIDPGNEIELCFKKGRLIEINPPTSPGARWLHDTQIQKAKMKGDQNWSHLAEIGIGVNPGVDNLTGNMLFDEKAAGTAHIALGSNTFMGGSIDAAIHCDMVTKSPTIMIDGKTIMERGRLRISEPEWHEHYSEISLEESPLQTATNVARTGTQAQSDNGRLQRVLRSEPGRVSTCSVGDTETSKIAHALYSNLPVDGDWANIDVLATSSQFDPEVAQRVLHIMWNYELIKWR